MLSTKEVKQIKAWRGWEKHCESESGKMSAEHTRAQRCLDGTATEGEYNSLDKCYASYDGTFTYVGPGFGPLTIKGPNALKAWNRINRFDIFAA